MRRTLVLIATSSILVFTLACGGSGNDVVSTTGTTQPRAAVTATPSGATGQLLPTPTAAVTATATSTPTVQPTPAPKAQAVTILAQGFGQEPDGLQVGWAFTIENPNPGLAVESSQYQIALSDDSGTILKTVSGYIELLLPSEQTAVSGTTILPEGTKATKIDITLKQGSTGTLDVAGKFTADKVTYLANGYVPAVSGIISNPFNKDLENLRLSAVAYDESNKIIGSGYTFLNFIPAGGKSGVTVSMTSSADPAHVELYASISALTTLADSTSKPVTGEPLVISSQGFGQSSDLGRVGFGFVLENPNKDQAYEDTMYQVAAYDENGVVIGDESGAIELLLPGQKLGSAGELSLPDGKTAARVEVQVLKGDPSTTTITEMFTSENVTYVADKYFPKVTGVVKNLTDKTLEDIRVSAIAYNDAGQIVGGGYTYVDFVPANAQIAAEVRITTKEVPARVELYPVVTSLTSLAP